MRTRIYKGNSHGVTKVLKNTNGALLADLLPMLFILMSVKAYFKLKMIKIQILGMSYQYIYLKLGVDSWLINNKKGKNSLFLLLLCLSREGKERKGEGECVSFLFGC